MVFLNIRNAEALESPCAQQIRSKSVKVPIPMCIQTFLFAFALNILSASFAMAHSSWAIICSRVTPLPPCWII
jgi:hypothetical protein